MLETINQRISNAIHSKHRGLGTLSLFDPAIVGVVGGADWTYENDFSTTTGILEQDAAAIGIDTGNSRIDYSIKRDNTNDALTWDITATLSNTTWIARNVNALNTFTTDTQSLFGFLGFYSANSATSAESTQDGLYMKYETSDGFPNQFIVEADGQALDVGGTSFTEAVATGTDFMQWKRTSATNGECGLFPTSAFGTPDETQSITMASTSIDYQFWGWKNRVITGTVGTQIGTIKTLQINDGTTLPP